MNRLRLPNRRRSTTHDLTFDDQSFTVSVGFDQIGRARELFIRGQRPDSALDRLCTDASIAISLALQHGVEPAVLAKAVGAKGSVIGAALAVLAEARP